MSRRFEPEPDPESLRRLRVLWAEHLAAAFPDLPESDPRAQEVVFYASWVGSLAEAAIASRGRLDANQVRMLAVRRGEGNQAVWAASGGLGEPARALVARLLALEEALVALAG